MGEDNYVLAGSQTVDAGQVGGVTMSVDAGKETKELVGREGRPDLFFTTDQKSPSNLSGKRGRK